MNEAGGDAAEFGWEQDYDDGWLEGMWVDVPEDYEYLTPGQGLWFYSDVSEEGVTYSLSAAGEPLLDARNVPLRPGFAPIAIPLARAVNIAEIKPDGYQENPELVGNGTYGNFQIKILNEAGGDDAEFGWEQDYDDGWLEGVWIGEDHTFQPGDAIWAYCDIWEEGKVYTLNFPGLED